MLQFLLLSLLPLSLAAPLISSTDSALKPRASICNGHASLCGKLYSEVVYLGAHDSYTDSSILPQADQELDIPSLLNMGARMLQAQAHTSLIQTSTSDISLCHTSCWLYDYGTLEEFLSTVKTWMDSHTTEVVTLLFVNSDNLPPSQWATAFTGTGIDKYAYSPPAATLSINQWPTLGQLIDSGKRLVVFLASQANYNSVPWLIDEFSNMYETPYDTLDTSFPCTVDRGAPASGKMGLINHYLDEAIGSIDIPDTGALSTTNSAVDIIAQADDCLAKQGSLPTFILMDFVDQGDPMDAVNALNGVS